MNLSSSNLLYGADRRILAKLLKVPGAAGYPISNDARMLDLGCGNGNTVYALREMGYNVRGCDIQFQEGPYCEQLQGQQLIHKIETAPYRLPFDADAFDYVFSQQVFEHVQDYDGTLAEIRRVLHPDGVSLHIFPSRLRPIESHVYVPFASVFCPYGWLLLWAGLGVRNSFQRGLNPRKVALRNRIYLMTKTNYLSRREIVRFVRGHFEEYYFSEGAAMRYSRLAQLYPILRLVPGMGMILSTFQTRVLLLARPRAGYDGADR